MKVLFLCTQNACRSQMAELWARELHGAAVQAASAGTHPATPNPGMLAVMEEAGVDTSHACSTNLNEYLDQEWDLVVTLCDAAAENCPVFPGAQNTLHQAFPDPAHAQGQPEEVLTEFRRVRDLIREFVAALPVKDAAKK